MLILSSVIALQLQFDNPQLPSVDISANLTTQGLIVPTQRGFSGDTDFSIALLPSKEKKLSFALREFNADCLHYGQIETQQPITEQPQQASYHVHSNTCAYESLNADGHVTVQAVSGHTPQPLEQAPWQPKPPQINHSEKPTVYGWAKLDKKGRVTEHYSSQDTIALPAYSLSKTFVTANAALWLQKHHKIDLNQQSIGHWVPECEQPSWKNVTWVNALNMQTGHYDSKAHKADESAQNMIDRFFLTTSHSDKVTYACNFPNKVSDKQPIPMVYQTTASYLLSSAIQTYLQQHGFGRLDDLLYENIWRSLALSPLAYSINHTADTRQQVWGGYGLSLLSSDLVKLAAYVRADPDQLGFAETLNNPENAMTVPGHDNLRYHKSIWLWQEPTSQRWIPFLSGYGGIMVVFLDKQHIYYLVSDQHDHRFASVLKDFWRWKNQLAP